MSDQSDRASPERVRLHAAGSLKSALRAVAEDFERSSGHRVEAVFGASGLLRARIEKGEPAQVFASADMAHPRALEAAGRGRPVMRFARNRLCVLARAEVDVSPDNVLDVLLDADIRLGTSTPGADPSGDYAWELFRKAEALSPGAYARLDHKAHRLTGGPATEMAPAGRNRYAWLLECGRADVFLTYRTNARLATAQVPTLQTVDLPASLAVSADYGLIVLDDGPVEAWSLAFHILSDVGQAVLTAHGFGPGGPANGSRD